MRLTTRIKIQLSLFSVVAVVAASVMAFGYMKLPSKLFGIGLYDVIVQLPQAGGLYEHANVTYRGTEVGRVTTLRLTDSGVEAVLSLKSGIDIPSDLQAQVHSQTAVGEQYVALVPRSATARPLQDGDIIAASDTTVPPNINALLDAANRGVQAIPRENTKTVIDESYTAIGGLGPELSRIITGSTTLASDARQHLDHLTGLIDQSQPVLDAQTHTADAIRAWASRLAIITDQLRTEDRAVAAVIEQGGPAADEVRALFERLQPTLPIVLANLVSIGKVAITYQANIEQLLVLLPQGTAASQATLVPSLHTKQDYKGGYLSFNINLNLPPPCTTGFLPVQQQRVPTFEDYPDRPAGDLYCRTPQDSPFNVRGARNIPCAGVPGKRAPTAKMCESDEQYVPLNDGENWKGDPNATLSGQGVPQLAPGSAPPPAPVPQPPLAAAEYDPATGTYVGPDGRVYTQADLAHSAREQTWQTMLMPPAGN